MLGSKAGVLPFRAVKESKRESVCQTWDFSVLINARHKH